MKRIRRSNFHAWLEKLPPGEVFCESGRCPLQQYGGFVAYQRAFSPWHGKFVFEIDQVTPLIDGRRGWHTLTPKQCLDVLAEVA